MIAVEERESPKRQINPLGLADRVYVARYYEYDGPNTLGALFGKSKQTIESLMKTMKNSGEYDIYRNLTDEEYEKMINAAERSGKYDM
ncbi:hypothetical protein [Paenibacillus vini]|uniref:Uncharacterized protein n=1 Tax=Paenibacillus vini TaxID=1476024 RepID=A0ABQ4MIW7_9BACL|nr:hypothetical protein [Paenibacillus vini]GIP55921.1 hypothetical protein J42TS3_49560 [Paenibacillus vini]